MTTATTSFADMSLSEMNTHRGRWVTNPKTGRYGVLLAANHGTRTLLKIYLPEKGITMLWQAPENWELTGLPRAWAADGSPVVA